MSRLRVTFLGTGTSHGIPRIGCDCAVCRSPDPRNRRLRPSIWVQTDQASLLVDATPDLRQQALAAGIRHLDAVLLTHTHADHFLGLDDLRVFTQQTGRPMPLYGSAAALADVQRVFPYACGGRPGYPSLPWFELHALTAGTLITVAGVDIHAVALPHGWSTVYGYRFGRELAYLTDCHAVPDEARAVVAGVTVLALDGLRERPHPTHLSLEQACVLALALGARQTYLTHMSHETDHGSAEARLPATVRLAYDGLQLDIDGERVSVVA
jgi:phosphoribosyl 1,2-cyclic phosphate phosphodiesterase